MSRRGVTGVKAKRHKMRWTEEEDKILKEMYGDFQIRSIGLRLGRSQKSVIERAKFLELGKAIDFGAWFTPNSLARALGVSPDRVIKWTEEYGLPVHTSHIAKMKKKPTKQVMRRYDPDEFWEWAETHQDLIDFSKIDMDIFLVVPDWVDRTPKPELEYHIRPWTIKEQQELIRLYQEEKLTYQEIGERLERSPESVQAKLKRTTTHRNRRMWSEDEDKKIMKLRYEDGLTVKEVSEKVGRTYRATIKRFKYLADKEKELEVKA